MPFEVGDVGMAFHPQPGRQASEYLGRVISVDSDATEGAIRLQSWPQTQDSYEPDVEEVSGLSLRHSLSGDFSRR